MSVSAKPLKKKKNITSLVEMKTKLAKIQTMKKKKKETLATLSEQVESMIVRNKVDKDQEVDHVDVVAEEFNREIEGNEPIGAKAKS
ncbi:hypothetical protein E5676_scaffold76G00100 [Cucumis melo var. makuwa]|uniref:Uncharacterized protein n=1 Tax=Cucumis melo var. makuwa TaxID=1194695 RepID=A0A5A7VCV8_CUCMM|nr:hypothetical protein E6C27_scaffold17G001630 [Cucumis melo var. makuwa]TYK08710.1 hypothetical protein E5676_scaffold76G00100 [Cucumis melo var. makuwa]